MFLLFFFDVVGPQPYALGRHLKTFAPRDALYRLTHQPAACGSVVGDSLAAILIANWIIAVVKRASSFRSRFGLGWFESGWPNGLASATFLNPSRCCRWSTD
jgi:hypothetical protein